MAIYRSLRSFAFSLLLLLASPWHSAAQTEPVYIPCSYMTGNFNNVSSVVVAFSEGTAWEGEKWAWLTVFNPFLVAQTVEIKAYVDGYGLVAWSESVAGKSRKAWNMNIEIFNRSGRRGRTNFATEVVFGPPSRTASGIGVANLAVWDFNYTTPVYLLGTNLCGVWL